MQPADLARHVPFSVGWQSERLYRTASGPDPFLGEAEEQLAAQLGKERIGTRVELDGWDEALDAAWQGLVDGDTAVVEWVLAYRDARGDRSLIVTFADSARVVGRGAREYFGVTYPADRLLAHGDGQVAAMRSAIITVLDRHVRGAGLDVPPVSEVCGPPA